MNPKRVLEDQADRLALQRALLAFANTILGAAERRQQLTAAGLDFSTLKFDTDSLSFATALLARFRERALVEGGTHLHPLVVFLNYLLSMPPDTFGLQPADVASARRILEDTHMRAAALIARRSVGMLEDAQGTGIGTGVVVGRDMLLTCQHIFSKTGVSRARVRFEFFVGWDDYTISRGSACEVDLDEPIARGGAELDFTEVRVARTESIERRDCLVIPTVYPTCRVEPPHQHPPKPKRRPRIRPHRPTVPASARQPPRAAGAPPLGTRPLRAARSTDGGRRGSSRLAEAVAEHRGGRRQTWRRSL